MSDPFHEQALSPDEEADLRKDIADGDPKTGHVWRWLAPRLLATLDAERGSRPPAGETVSFQTMKQVMGVTAGYSHTLLPCPYCGKAIELQPLIDDELNSATAILRAQVARLSVHVHVHEKHPGEWGTCPDLDCSSSRSALLTTEHPEHQEERG